VSTILLVGSNDADAKRLGDGLGQAGWQQTCASTFDDAIAAFDAAEPDAVLVDIGRSVLTQQELRELMRTCIERGGVPALAMVSDEQLAGHDFTLGFADFLLNRPLSAAEAMARVRQALWRAGKTPIQEEGMLRCGELIIDTNRYEVYLGGAPVELTYKEYELLRFLALNQDKVFTREVLLNRVWGYDYFGGARTVDVHIRRLRSKIETGDHVFIDTVRNVGYRFRPSLVSQP